MTAEARIEYDWEARIEYDWPHQSLKIFARPDREHILLWPEHLNTYQLDPRPLDTVFPEGMAPYLSIPDELARAIYDALADHFGFSSHDARSLRKDYDAERQRVDKFITHLVGR